MIYTIKKGTRIIPIYNDYHSATYNAHSQHTKEIVLRYIDETGAISGPVPCYRMTKRGRSGIFGSYDIITTRDWHAHHRYTVWRTEYRPHYDYCGILFPGQCVEQEIGFIVAMKNVIEQY